MKIKPYKIHIPQSEVDDLKERLKNTRFPYEVKDAGWSRGVPLNYLKKITEYWLHEFDWREQEAALNEFPQFITEIDGQMIHFIHVKSKEKNAIPLILNHGYPGSVVEMVKIIGPLSDPRSHGGNPKIAFDIIVPSIPGFGFSNPVLESGWETSRAAKVYAQLMKELGYKKYALQGTDIGAGICNELALLHPDNIIGVHASTDPTALALVFDEITMPEDELSADETSKLKELREYQKEGKGYLKIQMTRPQTLAYALNDSPVGQLAWIIEKFKEWTNFSAKLPENAVDLDHILTNISVYWFTQSGASAANFLYNAAHAQTGWGEPQVPMGFAVFNTTGLMRRALDPKHQMKHWSEFKEGGHFPAMEAPNLLAADIQKFFSKLQS